MADPVLPMLKFAPAARVPLAAHPPWTRLTFSVYASSRSLLGSQPGKLIALNLILLQPLHELVRRRLAVDPQTIGPQPAVPAVEMLRWCFPKDRHGLAHCWFPRWGLLVKSRL